MIDQWIAEGTLNLPFSCDGDIGAHPSVSIIDNILVIDDTDEETGQSGGHALIPAQFYEDSVQRTILVIKSTTHPLRVNVGGELGTPHSAAGVFHENILAGDQDHFGIEFAPYCQAEVMLLLVQPGD